MTREEFQAALDNAFDSGRKEAKAEMLRATVARVEARRKSKLSAAQVGHLIKLIRDKKWSYSAVGRKFGISPRSARFRWLSHVKAQEGK